MNLSILPLGVGRGCDVEISFGSTVMPMSFAIAITILLHCCESFALAPTTSKQSLLRYCPRSSCSLLVFFKHFSKLLIQLLAKLISFVIPLKYLLKL